MSESLGRGVIDGESTIEGGLLLALLLLEGEAFLASTGVEGRWALLLPSVLISQSGISMLQSTQCQVTSIPQWSHGHSNLICLNTTVTSLSHIAKTANNNYLFNNYDTTSLSVIQIISSMQVYYISPLRSHILVLGLYTNQNHKSNQPFDF